jgi:hypothetical protein
MEAEELKIMQLMRTQQQILQLMRTQQQQQQRQQQQRMCRYSDSRVTLGITTFFFLVLCPERNSKSRNVAHEL